MSKIIKLDYITKIEGHAKLYIKIEDNKVKDVKLEIYEGARFFEDLVSNLEVKQIPIITSRICGMCSVSHQIASCIAIENAYELQVSTQTKILREVILLASTIQSHIIHLFFMVLPDYYNKSSAIELAKDQPQVINLGIKILSIAKKILNIIGGREVHSVTLRVGRIIALPSKEEIEELKIEVEKELDAIFEDFTNIFSTLQNPEFQSDSNFITLYKNQIHTMEDEKYNLDHYINDISFKMKKYSSSKFIKLNNKNIITSALSRLNMNHKKYQNKTKEFISKINIRLPSKNPFDNNFAQAVEIIESFEKTIKELGKIKEIKREGHILLDEKKVLKGRVAINVPRGILIHDYEIEEGVIKKLKLITPTTQNIQSIEDDIKKLLPQILDKSKEDVINMIERLIRAYDPCISCSTHFLKVYWE
ncbi:MAG: Ni/Fe hydrogenase subunit alpha [Nanoarchaeota archaeon]